MAAAAGSAGDVPSATQRLCAPAILAFRLILSIFSKSAGKESPDRTLIESLTVASSRPTSSFAPGGAVTLAGGFFLRCLCLLAAAE
jgi:hypothetical protein